MKALDIGEEVGEKKEGLIGLVLGVEYGDGRLIGKVEKQRRSVLNEGVE